MNLLCYPPGEWCCSASLTNLQISTSIIRFLLNINVHFRSPSPFSYYSKMETKMMICQRKHCDTLSNSKVCLINTPFRVFTKESLEFFTLSNIGNASEELSAR